MDRKVLARWAKSLWARAQACMQEARVPSLPPYGPLSTIWSNLVPQCKDEVLLGLSLWQDYLGHSSDAGKGSKATPVLGEPYGTGNWPHEDNLTAVLCPLYLLAQVSVIRL